jgi:alpha-L-arabinofuranosidase
MLTVKTKKRLINALTRKSLADELELALAAAAPLSSQLKRSIEVAMGNKAAALNFIAAVETAGAQSLSVDAKRRIVVAEAERAAGDEIIAQAEAAN